MKKTVACVIARTTSSRLPLKVLRHVHNNFGMLDFMLQRLKLVSNIDKIYLCTSHESVDDILEDVADNNGVDIYRGSPDAVIERMIGVGEKENADHIIRITGDNVFTAYEYIDEQINIHDENNLDYTRMVGLPVGASAEIMRFSAVRRCYKEIDPSVSEYLLLYMFNPLKYRCGVIEIKDWPNLSSYSLTVDVKDDLIRTRSIMNHYSGNPHKISLKSIMDIIKNYDIENSRFKEQDRVKMPFDKSISFSEFQKDMSDRKNKSLRFEIEESVL